MLSFGKRFDLFRHRLRWRVIFAMRALRSARLTDQPLHYVMADVLPGRRMRTYTLQNHQVRIEHGAGDSWIFQELFIDGEYAFDMPEAPKRIVDVGGNIGMFALWAAVRWPGAHIVSFEPDPVNLVKHRWVRQQNGIQGELVEACASTRVGTMRFVGGLEGGSHITQDESAALVPAVDLFPYLEGADLVKIDIEGGEWPIITDPRFAKIDANDVVLEYHPHMCPGPDTLAEAEAALHRANFEPVRMAHNAETGVGVVRGRRPSSRAQPRDPTSTGRELGL